MPPQRQLKPKSADVRKNEFGLQNTKVREGQRRPKDLQKTPREHLFSHTCKNIEKVTQKTPKRCKKGAQKRPENLKKHHQERTKKKQRKKHPPKSIFINLSWHGNGKRGHFKKRRHRKPHKEKTKEIRQARGTPGRRRTQETQGNTTQSLRALRSLCSLARCARTRG